MNTRKLFLIFHNSEEVKRGEPTTMVVADSFVEVVHIIEEKFGPKYDIGAIVQVPLDLNKLPEKLMWTLELIMANDKNNEFFVHLFMHICETLATTEDEEGQD